MKTFTNKTFENKKLNSDNAVKYINCIFNKCDIGSKKSIDTFLESCTVNDTVVFNSELISCDCKDSNITYSDMNNCNINNCKIFEGKLESIDIDNSNVIGMSDYYYCNFIGYDFTKGTKDDCDSKECKCVKCTIKGCKYNKRSKVVVSFFSDCKVEK